MPVIKIHPDFKYQNRLYTEALDFLSEVERKDLVSYQFLKLLFDDNEVITVQTSGSTGKPKEILLSKQAMLHSAEATGQFFNLQPKTKALHCLSTDFIAGKMMWVR
ncbi:MAG: O-succinylbenzoic acid--CoA ligase, partial [Bacteroidota bacterium]